MKKLIVLFLVISMLFCVACTKKEPVKDNSNTSGQTTDNNDKPEVKETSKIVLYFADSQGMGLCGEEREILADDAKNPEAVVKELIKGTENTELESVIPQTTKVLSCTLKDSMCTLDLSKDFIEIQGTASQEMAMYSVVNTLCGIDGVDKVKFLIEGEEVPLFGNYDFASPFEADMTFVKN